MDYAVLMTFVNVCQFSSTLLEYGSEVKNFVWKLDMSDFKLLTSQFLAHFFKEKGVPLLEIEPKTSTPKIYYTNHQAYNTPQHIKVVLPI